MNKTTFSFTFTLLLSGFLLLSMQLTSGCSSSKSSSAPNPVPSVAALSPSSAMVGGSAFPMRVAGTSFISGSKVRWNGSDRTTTYVSSTQLDASISAADLAAASTAAVTVFNPTPGGGTSNAVSFTVNNPTPSLSSLSPSSANAGSANLTLTVTGNNFVSSSVVRWNGSSRATTFVSSTQLQAAITSPDLAMGGSFPVTVYTPPNGGGTSNSLTFAVIAPNPVPSVSSVSPGSVAAGSPATVAVNGSNFVSASQVYFNGYSRPTTYTGSNRLQFTLSPSDLPGAGTANVTVVNPAPGGGTSGSLALNIHLSIMAKDLIYDPFTRLIYASVSSSAGAIGNTITEIDPTTGTIGQSFFIGSEPKKLAISDDGKTLYAALDGAGAVRPFDIATRTPGSPFALVCDFGATCYVEDIEVMPGTSETVAISRMFKNSSPKHAGVAIYDNGIMRPTLTARHTGSNVIEFSDSASTLYGYNNESSEYGFRRMSVDASGVTVVSVVQNFIMYDNDLEYDSGRLYTTVGRVYDPVAMTLLGSFPVSGLVKPDSSLSRIFYLTPTISSGLVTLSACAPNTFTVLDSQTFYVVLHSYALVSSFVRWGADGIAFLTVDSITNTPGQIYILRSSAVLPSPGAGSPPVLVNLGQNATAGGGNFFLTISGANFVRGAVVYLNGAERTTYFVSTNEVRAAIPASDIQTQGSAEITVRNPGATGTTSNPLTLLIQ
jgi:hypothetical protein